MNIAYNTLYNPGPGSGMETPNGFLEKDENSGAIIMDATCAPKNISYLQDINLQNEVRENLESLIDRGCHDYNYYKPTCTVTTPRRII